MSTQLSGESFLAVVQKSALVDSERLKRSVTEFQTQGGDANNATALAEHFIARTLLSKWQAEKLLLGKHKGYFLGKYRLISLLGKGGMSSVYLAEHTLMKRRCAIKVLPTKRVGDSSYLARFHREAQAVAALDHPNIVRAYDVDHQVERDGEIHFLVMEYVDGYSLQEWVAKEGKLGFVDAVDSIRQAAVGLAHAHAAGLVHRDIKPGKLLCDPHGTVKILDLGLARFFDNQGQDEALTIQHDEKVLGTADYLAPEQALDSHTVDARADIYSLGCTLYFMLTGHPPFTEGTLTQRLMAHQTKEPPAIEKERSDTPESLAVIVRKMMAKKVDDRYASANETAEALRKWLAGNAPADWKKAHSGLFANDVTRATAVVASVVTPKKDAAAPAASVITPTPAAGKSAIKPPAAVVPPEPPAAEPELAAFFAGMADNPPPVIKSPSSLRLKSVPPEPPTPPAKSPSSIKRKAPAPKSAVVPAPPPPVAAPAVSKAPPVKAVPVKAVPVKAVSTPPPAPPAGGGAFDFLNAAVAEPEAPAVFIDTTPPPAVVVTPATVAKAAPPIVAPTAPAAPVKATPAKAVPVKATPVQATTVKPPAIPATPVSATPVPASPVITPPAEAPAVTRNEFDFLNVGGGSTTEPTVLIDTTVAAAAPSVQQVADPVAAQPIVTEAAPVTPAVVPVAPVEVVAEPSAATSPASGAFDFLNAPAVESETPTFLIDTSGTPPSPAPEAVAATAASVENLAENLPEIPVESVVPSDTVVAVEPSSPAPAVEPPGFIVPVIEEPATGLPFINVAAAPPAIAKPVVAKAAPGPVLPAQPVAVAAPVEVPGETTPSETSFFVEPPVTDANPFAFTSPAAAVVPSVAVTPPPATPAPPAAAPPPAAAKSGGVPKVALIGGGAVIALLLVGGLGYGLGWFGGSKPVVKKPTKSKSTKVVKTEDGGGGATKATANSPWRMKRLATVSPAGDFKTLNEALQIVKQHFTSQIRSDRFTIKVSAGTYAERIVIDGKTWPANISVVGEGAVILEPSGADPVVQLTSVEGVQLQGLTIKAAGKPVAIQLTGNMARVKLQKVTIDGFSEAGLTLRGAAGLSFSDARCQFEEVTIRGGGASSVGVKASKHDDVDPSNLVFNRCRFLGPLAAGVTISSKDAAGLEFRESIFHATTVGVHFLNKSSWRDDVFVQNTFHQCGHGLLIAEQPETSSKGLSIRRNLFLGTKTAEIQVEKGFDDKLLINNQMLGPIGQNWSDRARPEKPVGEVSIFGADSQPGRADLKLATTDPANAKFLAPAAGSPQGKVGGQGAGEKPWVGAVGP